MELYRIALARYSGKLMASGSSNRWNRKGEMVIYAGSSRALATLELVVHRGAVAPGGQYRVMVISVADHDRFYRQLRQDELPDGWRRFGAYARLQEKGSEWYRSQQSLLLKVPSAVIPQEHNYVINTEHPDFERHVKLVRTEDYFWDERLQPEGA